MKYHVTNSELEILNVMWAAERPLTRGEILALSKDKTWKDNSIHILLNGMLERGTVTEAGIARSGKVFGRQYAPTISIEEYYRDVFSQGPAPNPKAFLEYVLQREDMDAPTIRKLRQVLDRVDDRIEQEPAQTKTEE